MKKGYTLAEILITLGIIGIVSALIFPLANRMRPNENKVKFLQTYDAIAKVVKELANDSSVYPAAGTINIAGTPTSVSYLRCPFCNVYVMDNTGNIFRRPNKLGSLIAERFNSDANTNTIQSILNYDPDSNGNYYDNLYTFLETNRRLDDPHFTTDNGIEIYSYTYVQNPATNGLNSIDYATYVYFDIDGAGQGNGCFSLDGGCQEQDIFKLRIDGDGTVIPADPLGAAYLRTRNNLYQRNNINDIFTPQEIADFQDLDNDWFSGNLTP